MAVTAKVIAFNSRNAIGSHQFGNDDDLVKAWLRSQRSQMTVLCYEKAIREFRLFQKKELSDITISDIQDWFEWLVSKGLQPASVNLKLSAIRSCFDFGFKTQFLSGINPTEYVKCLPCKQKTEGKALTPDELDKFLTQLDKESKKKQTMFLFLLGTGCRISALLNLKHKQLKPINDPKYSGEIDIKNKGGNTETIPIIKKVWDLIWDPKRNPESYIIESTFTGGKISEVYVNNILKVIAQKAGIRKITTHVFRHTALSIMLANGADIETVRKAAIHSSIRTTQRYLHTAPAGVGEYVEKIFEKKGKETKK